MGIKKVISMWGRKVTCETQLTFVKLSEGILPVLVIPDKGERLSLYGCIDKRESGALKRAKKFWGIELA